MPSLLPGFEYDIFISYRHNDNRSGWVTEFVKALQEELAATIKDPVSVYFDTNPHDGLLETHNVDKSLEGKLKCLIFIPIISQTYCDPKSFAWQHEFCVFNKMAKEDTLGREVRLASGNVTSRILPVKIHDLEPGDKALLEGELNGVLRSIEFIYKSAGVNRPLRPNEEEPKENLNHTTYRNQINKLANAIKDIVASLQLPEDKAGAATSPQPVEGRSNKRTILSPAYRKITVSLLAIAIILTVIYFFMGRQQSAAQNYDYDVAVMYLENFTDNEKYGDGLANLIHINLAEDTTIRVLPRQRLFDEMAAATGTAQSPDRAHVTEIARKIRARTMITGSVHQENNKVLVQLELINVSTGRIMKSVKLEGNVEEIFSLADNICKQIAMGPIRSEFNVALKTTGNYLAYQKYYHGLEDFYVWRLDDATRNFREAIMLDSTFALGYLLLAQSEEIFSLMDVSKDLKPRIALIEKARKYAYKLTPTENKLVELYQQLYTGNFLGAEKLAIEVHGENPHDRFFFLPFMWVGWNNGMDEYISILEEYLKLNPSDGFMHNLASYTNAIQGNASMSKFHLKRYLELEPNTINALDAGFESGLILGEPQMAWAYEDSIEQRTGHIRYIRRGRYFLSLGKSDELKALVNQYHDSVPAAWVFHEMLPLGLMLEGKFNKAEKDFDKLISQFGARQAWTGVAFLRIHKGIVLMAAHQYEKAIAEFDAAMKQSTQMLKNEFNPIPPLCQYYAGLAYARQNKPEAAEKRLGQLKDLLKISAHDWRFGQFADYLEMEILILKGEYTNARDMYSKIFPWSTWGSVACLKSYYTIAWKLKKYDDALSAIIPFEKNYLRTAIYQGGDPAHFAWERAFADYTTARIYEDAGNMKEALNHYRKFLEQFKDSDPGIPEKEDAENRMKQLGGG